MNNLTFECPNCAQSIEAPSSVAGSEVTCPTCSTSIPVPNSPSSAQNVVPAEAEVHPSSYAKDQIIALTCRNCGGQLDFSAGDEVAMCPFCGSTNVLREPPNTVEKLRDLEGDTLSISYFLPTIAVRDAKLSIISAIKQDSAGFKDPDKLPMHAEGLYLPAWRIDVTVDCSWYGEYSERRTVTKYRKVTKYSGGRSYEETEPYNETETTWHPQNGRHAFELVLYTPAASGFSMQELATAQIGAEGMGDCQGHPRSDALFAISRPSKSQRHAWHEFGCDQEIDAHAREECCGCIERLNKVSHVVSSKDFSLVYLPIAVVSYTANEGHYRHFVNLRTGDFLGDIPLDHESVAAEARKAGLEQKTLSLLRSAVALAATLAATLAVTAFCNGKDPFAGDTSIVAWLIFAAISILTCQPGRAPWRRFLFSRKAYLLRLLINPPSHLREALISRCGTQRIEELQNIIDPYLENGGIESIPQAQASGFLIDAGYAVLQNVCPDAVRFPRFGVRAAIFALFIIATIVITQAVISLTGRSNENHRTIAQEQKSDESSVIDQPSQQSHAELSGGMATPSPQVSSLPYEKAAEEGDAVAQYNFGQIYAMGNGVPEDDVKAMEWFQKAADQGNSDAEYSLAFMYAHGDGVTKDDAKAIQWFQRAASQGNTAAQHELAIRGNSGPSPDPTPQASSRDTNGEAAGTAGPSPENGHTDQTSMSAAATEENAFGTEQVGELVDQNLRLSNERNVNGLLAERGDKVDYFDEGVVDQNFIRSDMTKYFDRWPYGKELRTSPMKVQQGTSPDTAVIFFRTHFRVENSNGMFIEGDNDNTLVLQNQTDGLKIISEKSHVTNRHKGTIHRAVSSEQISSAAGLERTQAPLPSEQSVSASIDTSMPRPNADSSPEDSQVAWQNAPINQSQSNIDSVPLLSPERVVSDVWNQDLRITAANFRSLYSGKMVRYTGTIVRKNLKEQLLVFRGGGFMTTAYDVQVDLNEDAMHGFDDVKVGNRITVVGTLDRLVPPAFGFGSNSIRINDARIYKIAR